MVILAKIVKIGQLQMGVESRETTNDSGFFHLKLSDNIAEQKKLHLEHNPDITMLCPGHN
jgi:hypothetical protein